MSVCGRIYLWYENGVETTIILAAKKTLFAFSVASGNELPFVSCFAIVAINSLVSGLLSGQQIAKVFGLIIQ